MKVIKVFAILATATGILSLAACSSNNTLPHHLHKAAAYQQDAAYCYGARQRADNCVVLPPVRMRRISKRQCARDAARAHDVFTVIDRRRRAAKRRAPANDVLPVLHTCRQP